MSIIGTLIGIVFICLLAKAILETIWGLCIAIYALFMMFVVAPLLYLLAWIVQGFERIAAKGPRHI